jgi:hypothetical protein
VTACRSALLARGERVCQRLGLALVHVVAIEAMQVVEYEHDAPLRLSKTFFDSLLIRAPDGSAKSATFQVVDFGDKLNLSFSRSPVGTVHGWSFSTTC